METEKKKLTDTQLRIAQGIAGIVSAAVLMVTIGLSSSLQGILSYLFVAVFVVITIGRRWVENKYRVRLNFFNLVLIDGILAGIFVYLIMIFYFPKTPVAMTDLVKLLIVVGVALFILVLGVVVPFLRYKKRKENDTLVPIRVPEKTEEEANADKNTQYGGRPSIAQQIAEMTKELENNDEEEKQ